MLLRWLSALAAIPIFLGICLWGAVPFAIGILLVAAVGLMEMQRTYRANDIHPNPLVSALGLLGPAWPLLAYIHAAVLLPLSIFVLLTALVWEVAIAARTGEMQSGRNLGYGLLCGAYIALFGGLTTLRAWPGHADPPVPIGIALVFLAAFCVWATDSLALFVGRAFGKHKLAPKLSPGKTVEGALGGLAGALVVGAVFGAVLLRSPLLGLAVGAVAGIFGQVGDLFESALKREAGIKDFGAIMPGHGGVLDRFDSLLVVAPLVALLLLSLRI